MSTRSHTGPPARLACPGPWSSCCASGHRAALGTGTPGTGTPPPADLVGDWHYGAFGSTNYYNPDNGSYSAPSGTGNAWTFKPDGRFVNAQLVQQSFYGCTTRVFWYDKGTYATSGGRLTLRSEGMYMKSEDTCNARYNYERTVDGHNETLAYAIDATGGDAVLAIHWPDQTLTFRR